MDEPGESPRGVEARLELPSVSCVKLETDFEQSIDEINTQKLRLTNGVRPRKRRSDKDPNYRDDTDSDQSTHSGRNGYLPPESKRKKTSPDKSRSKGHGNKVKGGKHLTILNHQICTSEPVMIVERKGGKPFSHQMSQIPRSKLNARTLRTSSRGGEVPQSGKPRSMMVLTSKKKQSKRALVETYHSQISEDRNTIKIKIRKASSEVKKPRRRKSRPAPPSPSSCSEPEEEDDEEQNEDQYEEEVEQQQEDQEDEVAEEESDSSSGEEYTTSACIPLTISASSALRDSAGYSSTRNGAGCSSSIVPVVAIPTVVVTPTVTKPRSDRQRKTTAQSKGSKSKSSDATGSGTERKAKEVEPQGPWGAAMPEEVLITIFRHVVDQEGSLPSLLRLGEVCKSWHAASVTPALWTNVELSRHTKDKWKTDHRLVWLMENRLSMCQQLNLSNWKASNLAWVVGSMVECCPSLEDLNLTGWKWLSVDQLRDISCSLPRLARLDLSCTSETGSSGGCLSVASLTQMCQGMGERLTHLTLANNKIAGLPVILNAIATHCSNMELLDLSNLWAVSHPALVPLERLQIGCPRLRVLRITNSQVVLANATSKDQMESPGFPLLEELSVACPSTNYKLVNDEALGRILKASKHLRLLDVRGCIRITDSGIIKVPAWDLQHLFLSGCCVTRQSSSCLELICEKWSHSLLEVDLAWSTATRPLDAAVDALAEKGANSKLRILNLCGSSVSFEPVKRILLKCPNLDSVNLASCRALPRGMKRLYTGHELQDLKDSFDPVKKKEKEEQERLAKEKKKKAQEEAKQKQEEAKQSKEEANVKDEDKDEKETPKSPIKEEDIKSPDNSSLVSEPEREDSKVDIKTPNSTMSSPTALQVSPSVNKASDSDVTASVRSAEQDYSPQPANTQTFSPAPKSAPSVHEPFSPQPSTSGISTPRSNLQEFSPAGSQVNTDPVSGSNICDSDSRQEMPRVSSGWNVDQFSPMNKQETLSSSQPSPDTGYSAANPNKQDTLKTGGNWNIGHYSPSVSRQESPYSCQISPSVTRHESPYSSQNSPSVASPYSSQIRSPSVVRQESPYSSVKSPSVVRQESPYSSVKSPSVVRQESPYSSHVSPSVVRQESPYSSQKSPYQSVRSPYTSQKSPDVGQPVSKPQVAQGTWNLEQYSPVMRQESASSTQPSPDPQVVSRNWNLERFSPMPSSAMMPSPDTSQVTSSGKQWNLDRFSPMTRAESSPVAAPSPEMSSVKPSQWHFSPMTRPELSPVGQPSPETGQPILKPNSWTAGPFSPLARQEPSPGGHPSPASVQIAPKPIHNTWNLGQYSPMGKVDSSSGVQRMAVTEPLPSMWGIGGLPLQGPLHNVSNVKSDLERTGVSAFGDQVTTTTYCTSTDQSLYRGYRDPINGPSSID